jgi:hypothetical protein
MITIKDLRSIAKARLRDAEVLTGAKRYDGAVYLCGYAVEIVLKARVCQTLKWGGYPSTGGEFQGYQSFRTHDLDVLLHLSGRETIIKTRHLAEWSVVLTWDPNARYSAIGSASPQDAVDMVSAARVLLSVL